MALPLCRLVGSDVKSCLFLFVRYGHRIYGKAPEIARNLKQRLQELDTFDPSVDFKVDISLPKIRTSRAEERKNRMSFLRNARSNPELERLSRTKQLQIPLKDVKEEWMKTAGPFQIRRIAEHYGVFKDLYGDAYFTPRVMVNIAYKQQDDTYLPVHRGNVIKPAENASPMGVGARQPSTIQPSVALYQPGPLGVQPQAALAPEITYESNPDDLWTLILTNPDGHLTKDNAEYIHWFIGNIPGSDISKGENIVSYLQPFPPRGIGYHRLIFVLYKQEKKMDYSNLKKEGPCLKLEDRTFSTLDFYRERQDDITPAGLAFFQSDWDASITHFFHKVLEMEEPVYEYDFPPPYIRPQEYWPLRRPFNLYMDKYRDPKQINKEYLMKKFKKVHPFRTPDPPPMFPNAFSMDQKKIPSWLRVEMKKDRLGWGRINDV